MKKLDRVQVETGAELRAWLESNYTRSESIWLVTFKKHVPDKYISGDEIVEEALCYGWMRTARCCCSPRGDLAAPGHVSTSSASTSCSPPTG